MQLGLYSIHSTEYSHVFSCFDMYRGQRSPFFDEIRSMIRTLMMTTGELDYDGIFRLGLDDGNDGATELRYLPVAYILFIPFVILMPVLFANMLVRCMHCLLQEELQLLYLLFFTFVDWIGCGRH